MPPVPAVESLGVPVPETDIEVLYSLRHDRISQSGSPSQHPGHGLSHFLACRGFRRVTLRSYKNFPTHEPRLAQSSFAPVCSLQHRNNYGMCMPPTLQDETIIPQHSKLHHQLNLLIINHNCHVAFLSCRLSRCRAFLGTRPANRLATRNVHLGQTLRGRPSATACNGNDTCSEQEVDVFVETRVGDPYDGPSAHSAPTATRPEHLDTSSTTTRVSQSILGRKAPWLAPPGKTSALNLFREIEHIT